VQIPIDAWDATATLDPESTIAFVMKARKCSFEVALAYCIDRRKIAKKDVPHLYLHKPNARRLHWVKGLLYAERWSSNGTAYRRRIAEQNEIAEWSKLEDNLDEIRFHSKLQRLIAFVGSWKMCELRQIGGEYGEAYERVNDMLESMFLIHLYECARVVCICGVYHYNCIVKNIHNTQFCYAKLVQLPSSIFAKMQKRNVLNVILEHIQV